jgi:long-chain acyl-CoA synthetase
MSPPAPPTPLDVTRTFQGKGILFAGATGFLGKVALSMLLERYGEALGKVHVVVRRGSSASAERRFFDKVATSEPFQPLRDKYGGSGKSAPSWTGTSPTRTWASPRRSWPGSRAPPT